VELILHLHRVLFRVSNNVVDFQQPQ